MDWHYSVFWIVLIFKLTCGEYCLRTLETKRDVSSCPKNKQEWEAASKRMDCSEIKKTGNCEDVIYHCLRDAVTNTMVEVCTVPKNLNGYCPYFYHNPPYVRNDYYRDCSNSSMCPTFYSSKDAYNYSACYNDTSIVTTVSASEPTSSTVLNPTSVFTVQTISASGIAKESETSNNTWKWVLPLVIIFLVLIVVHISLVVWVKKRGKRISVREACCIHLYILKECRKDAKDEKGIRDSMKEEKDSLLQKGNTEGNNGNKDEPDTDQTYEKDVYSPEASPEAEMGQPFLETSGQEVKFKNDGNSNSNVTGKPPEVPVLGESNPNITGITPVDNCQSSYNIATEQRKTTGEDISQTTLSSFTQDTSGTSYDKSGLRQNTPPFSKNSTHENQEETESKTVCGMEKNDGAQNSANSFEKDVEGNKGNTYPYGITALDHPQRLDKSTEQNNSTSFTHDTTTDISHNNSEKQENKTPVILKETVSKTAFGMEENIATKDGITAFDHPKRCHESSTEQEKSTENNSSQISITYDTTSNTSHNNSEVQENKPLPAIHKTLVIPEETISKTENSNSNVTGKPPEVPALGESNPNITGITPVDKCQSSYNNATEQRKTTGEDISQTSLPSFTQDTSGASYDNSVVRENTPSFSKNSTHVNQEEPISKIGNNNPNGITALDHPQRLDKSTEQNNSTSFTHDTNTDISHNNSEKQENKTPVILEETVSKTACGMEENTAAQGSCDPDNVEKDGTLDMNTVTDKAGFRLPDKNLLQNEQTRREVPISPLMCSEESNQETPKNVSSNEMSGLDVSIEGDVDSKANLRKQSLESLKVYYDNRKTRKRGGTVPLESEVDATDIKCETQIPERNIPELEKKINFADTKIYHLWKQQSNLPGRVKYMENTITRLNQLLKELEGESCEEQFPAVCEKSKKDNLGGKITDLKSIYSCVLTRIKDVETMVLQSHERTSERISQGTSRSSNSAKGHGGCESNFSSKVENLEEMLQEIDERLRKVIEIGYGKKGLWKLCFAKLQELECAINKLEKEYELNVTNFTTSDEKTMKSVDKAPERVEKIIRRVDEIEMHTLV